MNIRFFFGTLFLFLLLLLHLPLPAQVRGMVSVQAGPWREWTVYRYDAYSTLSSAWNTHLTASGGLRHRVTAWLDGQVQAGLRVRGWHSVHDNGKTGRVHHNRLTFLEVPLAASLVLRPHARLHVRMGMECGFALGSFGKLRIDPPGVQEPDIVVAVGLATQRRNPALAPMLAVGYSRLDAAGKGWELGLVGGQGLNSLWGADAAARYQPMDFRLGLEFTYIP